ncbi:hypothetical protein V6N11_024206 [Hibiscus sabdariffa]|uniref:Uncharacterized protein n=1 Tax=Hibiscus sabdariffa TaxID=183260 RepID=A0ABR2N7V7_9ROSI
MDNGNLEVQDSLAQASYATMVAGSHSGRQEVPNFNKDDEDSRQNEKVNEPSIQDNVDSGVKPHESGSGARNSVVSEATLITLSNWIKSTSNEVDNMVHLVEVHGDESGIEFLECYSMEDFDGCRDEDMEKAQ